jgi:hypothetical protein
MYQLSGAYRYKKCEREGVSTVLAQRNNELLCVRTVPAEGSETKRHSQEERGNCESEQWKMGKSSQLG